MGKGTLVLGKRLVSRTETLVDFVDWINHKDAVIGISPFFGMLAYLVKVLRLRKRFIYYCIDYYDPDIYKEFSDKLFIPLANAVDRFLVRHADDVWDITTRITSKRGLVGKRHKVVPLGYAPHFFHYNKTDPHELVFVGLKPYGLSLLNRVWDRIPGLKLTIIGMTGLIPEKKMIEIISWGGIGISLWEKRGNAYYGDPGKTKLYSACGLPVIVSNFTTYSEVITMCKAGIAINFNEEELYKALKEIIERYPFYKRNVKDVWKFCDSRRIFKGLQILD
jgi:glycosyltransferase involved in cell wall biosynthesis